MVLAKLKTRSLLFNRKADCTKYEYDAEGNRTKKSTGTTITSYSWDQRDRLTGATTKTSGTTNKLVTVSYDAFNRRIAEYAGNGSTVSRRDRYFWDGEEVHTIANGTTTPTVTDRFLMGPGIDNTIADEKLGTVNWTLTDIRGSIQEVLNSTGKSITKKDYSTFGIKTDTGNPSVTDTVFAYTGREYDPDLGLQYNRNRWYDPNTQRFMSADPAQADVNTYRYTGNGPTNGSDPSGLLAIPFRPRRKPSIKLLRNIDIALNLISFGISGGFGPSVMLAIPRGEWQSEGHWKCKESLTLLQSDDAIIASTDPTASEVSGTRDGVRFKENIATYLLGFTFNGKSVIAAGETASSIEELKKKLKAMEDAGMQIGRLFLIGHNGGQGNAPGVTFGFDKNRFDLKLLEKDAELRRLIRAVLKKNGKLVIGSCGYTGDGIFDVAAELKKIQDVLDMDDTEKKGIEVQGFNVKAAPDPEYILSPVLPGFYGTYYYLYPKGVSPNLESSKPK